MPTPWGLIIGVVLLGRGQSVEATNPAGDCTALDWVNCSLSNAARDWSKTDCAES